MYNFNYNLDINDLERFFDSLPKSAVIFMLFFLVVLVLVVITAYVFASLGIMEAAKKNKINNPWLAFIPVARYYLIGKLGYEVYAEKDKKNPTLTWVTFGVSAASFLLNNYYLNLATMIFAYIAFYNIFKANTEKYKMYTVLTVIFGELLGGIFLYAIRNKLTEGEIIPEAQVVTETEKEDTAEASQESSTVDKEEAKKVSKAKFCSSCGAKLSPKAKFCTNCGKEINKE